MSNQNRVTLYCLVTQAYVCEQLAQHWYMIVEGLGVEPVTQLP